MPKRTNQFYFPNMRAALRHEQTFSEHARHISEAEAEWWKPQGDRSWGSSDPPRLTSEGLRTWEMQTHVDHVYDLVPFWMRGVDAAERGEVLRMEEFLQKMEADGGWRTADEVWGMLEGWSPPNHQEGSDGWGRRDVPSVHKGGTDSTSDDQSTGWVAKEEWGVLNDHSSPRDGENVTHSFVDGIARQESADEKKRRRMHQFFRVSDLIMYRGADSIYTFSDAHRAEGAENPGNNPLPPHPPRLIIPLIIKILWRLQVSLL